MLFLHLILLIKLKYGFTYGLQFLRYKPFYESYDSNISNAAIDVYRIRTGDFK